MTQQILLNIGEPTLSELLKPISKESPIIAWWSGGITSAVACKLCLDWFGKDCVVFVFIGTNNEDSDTYRFKKDCEQWYDKPIETISSKDYKNIQEVWYKHLSLNVATGAICSYKLKQLVRESYQKEVMFSYQCFGFEAEEIDRAKAIQSNYPDCKPIFPLIYQLLSKKDCIKKIQRAGIKVPVTYKYGFHNNNCFQTGCVQGGIGYWQKMQKDFPDKFNKMAKVEHELSDLKGQPVTMLKDQSKGGGLVFLKPHPNFPEVKDISMMKGREPKPLTDCNGFCGTNDLKKSETSNEINYQDE